MTYKEERERDEEEDTKWICR